MYHFYLFLPTPTTPSQTFCSCHCGISDDFENDTVDSLSSSDDEHGPLLPLAVSNTLNNIADIFLDTFKKSHDTFLVETYPQGLETIG